MEIMTVSSGQVISGNLANPNSSDHISHSQTENVLNGGTVIDQISWGSRVISAGGKLINGYVSSGGVDTYSSGAIISGASVLDSGIANIEAGASARDLSVNSATLTLSAGAAITHLDAEAGSVINASGASLDGAVTLASGGIISGGFLKKGATEQVGGTVSAQTNSGVITVVSGGVISQGTVAAGGSDIIQSGGVFAGGTIANSGVVTVHSAGTVSSAQISAGAKLDLVDSASRLTGAIVNSGIISGGSLDNVTIQNTGGTLAGTMSFGSGVHITNGQIASGAVIVSSDSVLFDGSIVNNGTITATNGEIDDQFQNNGVLIGGSGSDSLLLKSILSNSPTGIISGNITLEGFINGGLLRGANLTLAQYSEFHGHINADASSTITGGTVSQDAVLTLSKKTKVSGLFFEEGGTIDINDILYDKGENINVSGNTLQITDSNNTVIWSLILDDEGYGPYASSDFKFLKNKDGSTTFSYIPCFLAGTLILTDTGERRIEELRAGDNVVTVSGDQKIERTIVWANSRKVQVQENLPDDRAGYPVCILKDALSDNVPSKDLFVTAEHCLFLDGKFVPVRMLVNGASIFYDRSITSYTCYHIETETHSVICADNVLTESYLDTQGKMRVSVVDDVTTIVRPTPRSWSNNAAAPLMTDRHFVEPFFRKFECRSKEIISRQIKKEPVLSHDPELRLITAGGDVLSPIRVNGKNYTFIIPAQNSHVQIISRTSRPCDVEGPFIDDRRDLGVLIGAVFLSNGSENIQIQSYMKTEHLKGWEAGIPSPHSRWTTGEAILPLPAMKAGLMHKITMEIVNAGPYTMPCNTDMDKKINDMYM